MFISKVEKFLIQKNIKSITSILTNVVATNKLQDRHIDMIAEALDKSYKVIESLTLRVEQLEAHLDVLRLETDERDRTL